MKGQASGFLYKIGQKPIIAAVRKPSEIQKAIDSNVDNIFFMGGSITELKTAVHACKGARKGAFIHLDLIRGLSGTDKESIEFVADYIQADGIVTPKSHMVKFAKQAGLYAILHLFVIDSLVWENGLRTVENAAPDGIELMPGVVPKVIDHFARMVDTIPIIASGLISTIDEARNALVAGATSLSVSEQSLWKLNFDEILND